MTLIVTKLNDERYDLEELGIRVVDFSPGSLPVQNTVVQTDGGGYVVTDTRYGTRYISAQLRYQGRDMDDFALRRAEVFDLFSSTEPFYIQDLREGGQRWFVKSDGSFSFDRKATRGIFDISFLCINKFAESLGLSTQLPENSWDSGLWGFGSRINVDKNYFYEFNNVTSLEIDNVGTAEIDPRSNQLSISVKGNFSNGVTLVNQTTGDTFIYSKPLVSTDILTIEGVITKKNDISVFGDTNGSLITLKPGINLINIQGGTATNISFVFRFLYK